MTEGGPIGNGERILVVEDESEFAALLELWLQRHGWATAVAATGQDALRRFYDIRPQLVLLDVSLPGPDGWQLVERIRDLSSVPVIFLTARGSEADKVRGLRAGADDYVTKPVGFPELIARVEAALRRAELAGDRAVARVIRRGDVVVDDDRHRVEVGGVPVHLTPTEFRLLRHLAERPGQLVGHRDALETIWGPGYADETHLLRMTIRNLRAKLESAAPGRRPITTVYGLGYRFEPDGG